VVDVNSNFIPDNVSVCYGNKFKCKSIDVSLYNGVDTSVIGDYQVKYVASYGKKKKTLVNNVKVVDKVNPVITTSSDEIYVCPGSDKYDIKYSASDNYDGDLSEKISMDVTEDSLIFKVSDSSGNVDSKTVNVKREDITGPTISLNDSDTMYIPLGMGFNDPGFNANDNCDGDLTDKVTVSGSVSNSVGKYVLTYTVTDNSGNSTSVNRTVNVYTPNTGDKMIYLTFDDGPSGYTRELLDILDRYNVKATFFVTGRGDVSLIGEEYRRGHAIGLHTYSHDYASVYASVDAYFNDLNAINEVVKAQTGSYSNIIRFPGGSSNTVSANYTSGIMSQLTSMVEARGYKYYDWNVSSGDGSSVILESSGYASNVINGLGNGSSYVVLQHDTNINSIRAVSSIIEYGLSHGYSFGTLDVNGPIVHHRVSN
jgi:peptidoglycan/xylan/chitin deacetylase (PgdA/CDA1 family)